MMLELEKKAYIYSVEAIGYSRSIEKLGNQSELAARFREAAGRVYTLLTDALEAEESKDFAALFRDSQSQASESRRYLQQLKAEEATLEEKKHELTGLIDDIRRRMNEIEKKLIC